MNQLGWNDGPWYRDYIGYIVILVLIVLLLLVLYILTPCQHSIFKNISNNI